MASTVHQSMLGGDGYHRVSADVRRRHIPLALREHRGYEFRKHLGGEMSSLLGQGQRCLSPSLRLVAIAQPPQDLGQPAQGLDPGIMPTSECR